MQGVPGLGANDHSVRTQRWPGRSVLCDQGRPALATDPLALWPRQRAKRAPLWGQYRSTMRHSPPASGQESTRRVNTPLFSMALIERGPLARVDHK
jgi:hypothetical protein